MGIHGFFQICRAKAPEAIDFLSAEGWSGHRLGIDAPALLHRARAASSAELSYLAYIVEQLMWLRQLGVSVLFVFDGEPVPAKSGERKRRRVARDTQAREASAWQTRLTEALDWDDIATCRTRLERHARAAAGVGLAQTAWMQQLLDSCGAAWCVAPHEAESLLATLQVCGRIDEIVTEDSDAIRASEKS